MIKTAATSERYYEPVSVLEKGQLAITSISARLTIFLCEQYRSVTQNIFMYCILFIGCVSIYDSYLVVQFREAILHDERNPICEMLIRKDPNSLSWFLAGKFLGNVGVIGILILLRKLRYQRTITVAKGVAFFQLCLLTYLTFSDHMTGFLHFDDLYSHDPERLRVARLSLAVHIAALVAITASITCVIQLRRYRNLAINGRQNNGMHSYGMEHNAPSLGRRIDQPEFASSRGMNLPVSILEKPTRCAS